MLPSILRMIAQTAVGKSKWPFDRGYSFAPSANALSVMKVLRNMRTLKQHAESKLSLELKNAETKVAILRQRISAIKPRTLYTPKRISPFAI